MVYFKLVIVIIFIFVDLSFYINFLQNYENLSLFNDLIIYFINLHFIVNLIIMLLYYFSF
jgi:hypothetical protein